ncbi:OmpW family outer membrane protein, partial [Vibrio anguillarum]|nr:outer membrane protein OmpW [Vibrio anguillarum]
YKYQGVEQRTDVTIDPWVFMIGAGYKF